MTNILVVANAGHKYYAARYYTTDRRLVNGLVRAGHNVWFYSDRDIARSTLTRWGGCRRANTSLFPVIENFQPDGLILLNANIITPETLAEIRKRWPHIRIAQLIIDAVFNPNNRNRWLRRTPYIDTHFFTTGGNVLRQFATPQKPCYFVPNMIDSALDVGRAFEQKQPTYDLVCTMMHSPETLEREALARKLKQQIPELRSSYHGFDCAPSLYGHAYIDTLSKSAMALSLNQIVSGGEASTQETRYLYSSDRIAHIMGNGSLACVPRGNGLETLYGEDGLLLFSSPDELIEKIRHYLKHPAERQKAAKLGWQKSHEHFNNVLVTQYMTERLFGHALSHDYAWPTEAITHA